MWEGLCAIKKVPDSPESPPGHGNRAEGDGSESKTGTAISVELVLLQLNVVWFRNFLHNLCSFLACKTIKPQFLMCFG